MIDTIKEKKIYIYCLGVYGVRMYYSLLRYGIDIVCFGDRDNKKQKSGFCGKACIPYDDFVQLDKESSCIIVANKKVDNLINAFTKMGFTYVYAFDEVMSSLSAVRCELEYKMNDLKKLIEKKRVIEKQYTEFCL